MADIKPEEKVFTIEEWAEQRAKCREDWELPEEHIQELRTLALAFLDRAHALGVPFTLAYGVGSRGPTEEVRCMCNLLPMHRSPFEFLVNDLISREGYGNFLTAQSYLERYGSDSSAEIVGEEDLATLLKHMMLDK